jgi:hypothetical protein
MEERGLVKEGHSRERLLKEGGMMEKVVWDAKGYALKFRVKKVNIILGEMLTVNDSEKKLKQCGSMMVRFGLTFQLTLVGMIYVAFAVD